MAEYRVEFTADSSAAERSIKNLKKEIKGVTKEFESAEIGADEFLEAASDLSGLQKELKDARGAVVNIDKAYQDLNKALDSIGSAYDKAGRDAQSYHNKLLGLAQDSFQQEDRLRNKNFQAEVDDFDRRLRLAASAASKMSAQQRAIMEFRAGMGARGAISEVASPIRGGAAFPGSPAYLEEIAKAAKQAQQELDDAAQTAGTIAPRAEAFQPASLAAYETKLKLLKKEARLISPDSERWKDLNKQILQAERGIEKINKRQRLGPTGGQRLGAAGGAFLYGGGLGGGVGSALGGVAGGLAGGVPGAFAGAALGQLSDNIGQALGATASYTAEIDKQRIALKNVTKDVAEYQSALGFIDKTSRDLAIPQDVLNKQFTQISASVIGAGGNVDAAKEAFLGIAAGIRGTGGSLADMQGALLATSQVFSKGKVSAEELRQQIGERLPGAFTLFAKSMGKTPQELDKMLEQGQVTLNDFMGFVRLLSSEYGQSALEIAASSQAAGDRLATTMSRMREAVGRELQPLGAQFQEILANAVADNEENLVALAKAFSQAAQAIGRFIEQYGGLIASLGSTVLIIGGTGLAVKGLTVAFAAVTTAIPVALAAIANYGGAVSALKLAMAGLGGPFTLAIAGLALLGKAAYDSDEAFRNFVDNIGGVIANDFKNAVEGMAEDARSSANGIQTAYEDLTARLDPIGQFIKQLFRDVFKDTSDSAETSAAASTGAFNNFFNSLSTSAVEGFNGLNTIIGNWWSSLPAPIRSIFGGNTASMLAGAASYAAALPGRASAPNAQSTGMYGRYGAPESQVTTPGSSGLGLGTVKGFPGSSGSGAAGAGSGKSANNKLKEFNNDRIQALEKRLTAEKAALDANLLLSERERSIEKGRLDFRYGNQIIDEQLVQAKRTSQEYQLKDRAKFIAEQEQFAAIERETLQSQLVTAIAPELSQGYQSLLGAYDSLILEQEALTRGKDELTEVEKVEILLARIRAGLQPAELARVDELAGAYLAQAKAVDILSASNQKQLALREALKPLQQQLQLAQILDPKTELRAQIKQEQPKLNNEDVEQVARLQEQVNAAQKAKADLQGIASSIGSSFGEAFKGIVTGSMTMQQALAGMFQSIADSFADMAAQMIADFMRMQALGLLKTIFSAVAPAIGGGLGSGFSAGTSSAIDTGAGGWASSFATPLKFANGGIAPGSFQAFANGGMVTGPTLGLVGEGRYNEAIIPLPDGKSVPVQLSGGAGGNAAPINTSIVVNVKNGQAESQMSGNQGNQLARELEGAVRQVILKESRPGGLISSSR